MMTALLKNRYRILGTLGSGGFGQTFLAEDIDMPSARRCVIKQLKPATNDPAVYQIIQDRFQREAAILEMLGRDNDQIPTLHAYFTEEKEFYLVQDWIEGRNLSQQVGLDGVLSAGAVCQLLSSLLSVLEYVHGRGIIHRDVKPENIMLRARDGKPVLIDFGAVKEGVSTVVDSQGRPISSVIIGTPGFMPLEQAAGQPVFASDIYSLGLTAIFLLTGKRPQELHDSATGQHSWRKHAANVSAGLAAVIDKAIQRAAHERYQTAREMNAAIMKIAKIHIPIPPHPVPPDPRPSWPKLIYALAAVLILVLAAGASFVGLQWRNPTPTTATGPSTPGCSLYNDDPSQTTVNIRTDCDTRSCDLDASTLVKEYPNNTLVRVNREVTVKSRKNFYWTKIVIVENGETWWVASSKIRCQ